MKVRNSRDLRRALRPKPGRRGPNFEFLILIFAFSVLLAGCAAPGEPVERKPAVPEGVQDLAAAQSGNEVTLTFTLPAETVEHRPLKQPPAIEVYRDFLPAPGAGSPVPRVANPTLLLTIPGGLVDHYEFQGRVRYTDSLGAAEFTQHAGSETVYMVRTRAAKKRASEDSNLAELRIFPAPDPIENLKAEVTHSAIVLSWTPPQKTVAGPAPPIAVYEIFRAQAAADGTGGKALENPKQKVPPMKLGESVEPVFQDTQFEFGKTYAYSVRSVAQYDGARLASADSPLLTVLAKDLFPPAAPEGLVVVLVPAAGETPAHLELSWAINSETDIAGYNVYRSEQAGSLGTRLNPELLLTPSFRDMNAIPGRRYSYSVTAVDRSGNESPAGAAASGGVPVESQATP